MEKVEWYNLITVGNGVEVIQKRRGINTELSYNPAILFYVDPKELKTEIWTDICTLLLIAALFTQYLNGGSKCSPIDK